jgi:AraC-like DNA-binding protein
LSSTIAYTCLLGLFLPLVLLFFNKGYLSANRYLAGFLFFASLYLLENFYFFYGQSLSKIAFFTTTHSFFYLIGPFAFFYMRSILRDNSKLSKIDCLHFLLFVISFIGYVPYFYSSWDYKQLIAQNLHSENWDIAPFHLNIIIPHKVDQLLNVLHTYFYSLGLWYLLRLYNKKIGNSISNTSQFKLIRNWFLVFTIIFSVITINFTIAMANLWIYDSKSIFLDRASIALLFASLIYIGMNMTILIFPHIMYGLPLDIELKHLGSGDSITSGESQITINDDLLLDQEDAFDGKYSPQLFTVEYVQVIETALKKYIENQAYLNPDFKLNIISNESVIPAHHLTYFFNNIKGISFSDWRNKLRIEHSKYLMHNGHAEKMTLESISINCGFVSQNTFIRAFKNTIGTTPSAYLKSLS